MQGHVNGAAGTNAATSAGAIYEQLMQQLNSTGVAIPQGVNLQQLVLDAVKQEGVKLDLPKLLISQ